MASAWRYAASAFLRAWIASARFLPPTNCAKRCCTVAASLVAKVYVFVICSLCSPSQAERPVRRVRRSLSMKPWALPATRLMPSRSAASESGGSE